MSVKPSFSSMVRELGAMGVNALAVPSVQGQQAGQVSRPQHVGPVRGQQQQGQGDAQQQGQHGQVGGQVHLGVPQRDARRRPSKRSRVGSDEEVFMDTGFEEPRQQRGFLGRNREGGAKRGSRRQCVTGGDKGTGFIDPEFIFV